MKIKELTSSGDFFDCCKSVGGDCDDRCGRRSNQETCKKRNEKTVKEWHTCVGAVGQSLHEL